MAMRETTITVMSQIQPLRDRLKKADASPFWLCALLAVIIAFAAFMVVNH